MSRSTRLRFPSQKAKENMETEAIVTFWRIVKKTHIQKSTDDIEQLKLLIEQVDTAYDAVVSSSTVVEEDISNAAKVLVDSIQEKIESLQENKSIRASSIHGCTSQVSYRSHDTDMKGKQSGIRLMDAVWNSSSTCGTRRTINKSLQSLPLFYEDKPRHLMHEPPMARSASQGALLAPHDSTLGDGTHIQKHVVSHPSRSRHSHMSTSRRHDTKENVDELRRKLEDLQRIQAEKEHERQERAKQERLQNQDLQRQTDALQQQINFVTFVNNESEACNNPLIANLFDRPVVTSTTSGKKCFAISVEERKDSSPIQRFTDFDRAKQEKEKWCLHCKRNSHYIYDCRTFSNKTTKEKKEFIMQQGLCYGCLDRGHMSNNCHQGRTCGKCKYKHPTSLHGIFKERYEEKKNNKEFKPKLETQAAATLNTSSTNSDTETYTMVLPVYVSSSSDSANEILVYAQLDTQSNTTLILEDVANELKMTVSKPASLQLTTMSSTTLVKCTQYEGLQIRGLHSSTVIPLPTSFGRTEIPGDVTQIPTIETARRYPHLQSIQDKLHKLQDCKIGLLVGCNCSRAIAPINCINTASPCAWETELGWCIVGTNQNASQSTPAQTLKTVVHKQLQPDIDNLSKEIHYSCSLSNKNEFSQIAKLLESDFIESKRDHEKMSQDDIQFLSIITASIHQKASKHYEMKLPFRGESQPEMSNNLLAVLKRLEYLRQRLLKNPQYHEDYTKFMTNIIDQGDAEPVPIEDLHNRLSWYLPHHGVYHPKKPEKIRVVFDCSMTHKGSSLNKALLQGPDMMNNLVGILCRFRKEPIAFIGDIERMYHRFHVTPSDRDYLRFMWYKDGKLDEEPTMYRMKVHLFGAVSSPACANFGLKRIAADHGTKETTKAVEFISDNFYVDDGLYSCQDVTQAIKVLNDARHICNEGNLRLHKIISNNESVLKSIPRSECADHKATQDLSFEEKTDSVDRVLGIQWATETDQFQFKLLLPQKTPTRRGILSTVASIFDPIGWISPFTLTGKIILQDICKHSYQWDDPLQDELLIRWNKWSSELSELSNIKIERCYKPHNFGRVVTYELHHFSDASTCGYGQCSYLRMIDEHGKIHCSLVMSKARVAPRKILTIPRLELMAAVTSVKIGNILKHELKYEMLEEFYWTDSKIVLCYLNNSSKRFHVFVANRVQFIRDHTKPEQWRYISTRSNPADHTSRGLHASELTSSNWMTGPKFLWDILPPPDPVDHLSIPINDPEIRKIIVHKVQIKYLTILKRIEHFSDWKRAVRGVNFLRCCIKHRTNETSTNQVVEVIETERFIIKLCQQEHFADEINLLKHEGASSGKLSAFDPFLDEHGILRIGGRLRMSTSMQYNVKHPILLPKEGHVTHLILKHFHEMAQHQGIGMTIGEIRSNGYYILGVTRLVTSFIFKCVQCRKLRSKTQEQKMADLPLDRLEPSPPFTAVGIDAFGPYFVTERRKELKRYGLIFVCQASRAIHIELLDDMSTDVFINALRCFIAIRGAVAIIRCDCGSNFIGASHELKKAFNEIDCERVKDILLDGHCQFIFNSPSSSHMGGTFERHIRTIRSILNNMLYEHSTRLDTSSLRTLMYEVMSLVNSRPLTYTYLHDKELEPLTPNHLITMKSKIITPPPGKFEASDIYARKRWRKVQQLTNEFWTRWRNEYILNMQQRQKWRKSSRDISIGDIVLLKEEDVYRGSWKMGKVVRIIGSTDHTRRVQLQLGNRQLAKEKTFLERPIHKLVLLVENSD